MGQLFIDEVRAIVLKNISNEKFGVGDLSSQLGLSSSQTLRKVKAASGKSVNQYIRELRLEKAAKLIKKTDDSMAEIAYQVGFSSPSYFNKAFAKYYGIAPGEYKTKSISLSELADQKPEPQTGLSTKKIGYVLAIVLVGVLGYFLLQSTVLNKKPEQKSIAVLPFKDFSPEDSQWFSDGVSDNILHSLAQMHDLQVTSFTSSATYRDTDKQIPQIAKELGVAYVLEGSITLYENDLKIIVQLIDAEDNHVWSREYNEEFKDVITIQNNVSQEVLKQLELTLSPEEQDIVEKYPTDNMEAYVLNLKGRQTGIITKQDLEQRLELCHQAISLDSSFVEPYTNIARTYYILSHRHGNSVDPFEMRELASNYADMALALDPKSSHAIVTKAFLSLYVDWDKHKEYIDKAIAINPNAQNGMIGTLRLLRPNPDTKRAVKETESGYIKDPLDGTSLHNYINALIANNQRDNAIEIYNSGKSILEENNVLHDLMYVLQHKDWKALQPGYEEEIKQNPDNPAQLINLATYHRDITYDYKKGVELCKKAYNLNPVYISAYVYGLVKTHRFEEAKELMSTPTYSSSANQESKLYQLWELYYEQSDFEKAHEILNDSIFKHQFLARTLTYAKAGNRKKVDSMYKLFPWGTGRLSTWSVNRAIIHAHLKDRDSMYHHLENIWSQWSVPMVNEHGRVFDPYRNEERFKSFLRKWYLPVPGE
ncbi:MAG: helix-turn-helix domain-containing protein [Bacteroidia bacterium]|nr:helix-turn-helix domain-containing protein [Bacteroidia bacterium]